MKRTVFAPTRLVGAMAAVLALAGCASISPDGLRGAVQSHTASRLPDGAQLPPTDLQARDAAQQRIDEWLRQPLDMDQSVRIALLNNPGLQARLAQLGVQDADRVQALTLPNPTLALGRMVNSDEREIERQLSFGLVSLITLPWRSRWQGMQMEQATLTAAQDVLRLAADTRRAWLRAVAARQQLAASERMHEAAEAGAELARRMARVGNFSRLQQARELSIQQDTAAQLARARLAATAEHEQLARLMGLWGGRIDFKLPDQLPAIPQAATQLRAGDDAEATALRERLDLRALRRDLDHLGERRGWARAGAIFGDIGLGYSRNTATDRATGHSDVTRGWEIDLPLPLFDWGGAASGRARRAAAQCGPAAARRHPGARRGAQQLDALPHGLGPGPPTAGRGAAAAPLHPGRNHASLQRHVRQRLAIAGRGPQQRPGRGHRHRCAARLLAGRDRPAAGTDRHVAGSHAGCRQRCRAHPHQRSEPLT